MNTHYQLAIQQIEEADLPDGVYRTARRLLDLAADHDGYVEVTPSAALAICRTEAPGTMRSHLNQLRRAGVINYQISNRHGRVMIRFTAYPLPVVEEWPRAQPTDSRAGRSNLIATPTNSRVQRANFEDLDDEQPDEPYNRALSDQIRAPSQQIRADSDQIRALGDQNGVPVLEGRKEGRNIDLTTLDQEVLPTGTAQTEQPTANSQPQPPPGSEAPSPDGLTADQWRTYALLVELGLSDENALKMAKFHTFAFTVKQVATWYGGEYGIGALYNRLLHSKKFPPGVPKPEFLASELYKRHYPLDRPAAQARARMAAYSPHLVDPNPLLDALPVPIWDE